jgi:hypothetical protein
MAIAPALAIVGGVISAVGALAAASAQAKAARFNAQVNERNAAIAREQGAEDAKRQQRLNVQRLGKLRAAYGEAGLSFEGDALSVFEDSAVQAELDVRRIKYNAELRAIGFEDQAQLDRMEAKAATTAGILGAASAFTGGLRGAFQTTGTPLLTAA